MIDEVSHDGLGWARFSDDRRMRYRLGRVVGSIVDADQVKRAWHRGGSPLWTRVVFIMLNPSTANAFKLDPTVSKCVKFAQRWGADVLEVVNLFAFRSSNPDDLKAATPRGTIEEDEAILAACVGPARVIAAWGNHGGIDGRAAHVHSMLSKERIPLYHLGTTDRGHPLHPLARGKSFIQLDREPEPLSDVLVAEPIQKEAIQ